MYLVIYVEGDDDHFDLSMSARVSKIANDGLIRSGTGYFIAVPIWQQWALSLMPSTIAVVRKKCTAPNNANTFALQVTAVFAA